MRRFGRTPGSKSTPEPPGWSLLRLLASPSVDVGIVYFAWTDTETVCGTNSDNGTNDFPNETAGHGARARALAWLPLPLVIAGSAAWLIIRAGGIELGHAEVALLSGIAIVCAAFLLTWAAEVAQLDVSQGLALAAVALIAVLPEYAVDLYFAWTAAHDPAYAHYAVANMTGANRLLIGFGWPLMVLLWWLRTKQSAVELHRERHTELGFLAAATVYAFVIPLKRSLGPIDAAVLLSIFAVYLYRVGVGRHVEPEL
ncbi:MAG: hypothetical protein H5T86_15705, partial [Armatimonadetes bacterium]|nr:hypothetical protein [Armatimonadota bacterium]